MNIPWDITFLDSNTLSLIGQLSIVWGEESE
jgi:hypothetical protein